MNWQITQFLVAFLLPPLNFLVLAAVGLVLLGRGPRLGKRLIAAMLALSWIFSMRIVGDPLVALLERDAHTPVEEMKEAQAIVVLGGGTYFNAPEYGGDSVSGAGLIRLRLAARLHRQTGLPLLISGGNPDGGKIPEAALMKRTLEEEIGVPVRWIEDASNNTRQNALKSFEVLAPAGVRTIVLVTHASRMARARSSFERAGFRVLPAGTEFSSRSRITVLDFLPSLSGLVGSSVFMRECIGLLWYRLVATLQPPR